MEGKGERERETETRDRALFAKLEGGKEEERERQSSESGSERRRDRRFRLSWMAQRGEEAEKGRTAKEEPDDSGTNGVPGLWVWGHLHLHLTVHAKYIRT